MNFKLLAATTLLFTIGSTTTAFSADKQELKAFLQTHQCVDCNLSLLTYLLGDLTRGDFRNANLEGANLYKSKLRLSNWKNSNFSNTDSRFASFERTDLRNANFSNANISGADFCEADLRGVNWTGVIYDNKTKCLPDEAKNYVRSVSSSSNQNHNNCPSVTQVSNANSRSLEDNVNDVKKATDTVKDILKLF